MIGYESAARYASLVKALTGDEELVPPGLVLEQDRREWSFLKRERLFTSGLVIVAANVANPSQVMARLPAVPATGPQTVVVFTSIKLSGANVVAGDRYRLRLTGAIAGAFGPGIAIDTRWGSNVGVSGATVVQFAGDNSAAASGDILEEVSASVTGQDLYFSVLPILCTDLYQVRVAVWSFAINKALAVTFAGYERGLRSEENAE